MTTEESRAYLKRNPGVLNLVKIVFSYYNLDYETFNNWQLRSIKLPDPASVVDLIVQKLYIANEFIVNVSPVTVEIQNLIKERYSMGESSIVLECRELRYCVSKILKSMFVPLILKSEVQFPMREAAKCLIKARFWFGQDLIRNGAEETFSNMFDYNDDKPISETDVADNVFIQHTEWETNLRSNIKLIKRLAFEINNVMDFVATGSEQSKAKDLLREALCWIEQVFFTLNGSVHAFWLPTYQSSEDFLIEKHDTEQSQETVV